MKLRNFANKFLLVTILLVFACGNFLVGCAPTVVAVTPADTNVTALSKTYYFDQYNPNKPKLDDSEPDQSIYEALGITVYNDYLTALSATKSLNEVVIAVVDTGLDVTHPVFTYQNFGDRVLCDFAMDFSQGLPTAENQWNVDENGHGTHVAGIIADATLPNVKILPIKIFSGVDNSVGSEYAFENAIRYLAALKRGVRTSLIDANGYESAPSGIYFNKKYYNNARIKLDNLVAVNLSLGTGGYALNSRSAMAQYEKDKTDFEAGIENYLWENGILPIVAAGNRTDSNYTYVRTTEGENVLAPYYSLPGACNHVLEVSAYDNTISEYALADFSFYNDYVSVAAPGAQIWSACTSSIVEKLADTYSQENNATEGYTTYKYRYGSKTIEWCIKQDENDQYYFQSSGTSMATPFVTACYALLMSDSSKDKNIAEDYGLTNWDVNDVEDAKFINAVHKALLAAAATDGVHYENGYEIMFGYGTVNVSGFVPATGTQTVRELSDIRYEPQYDSTADYRWKKNNSSDEEVADWFQVCVILLVAVILVWLFNSFRAYSIRRRTQDDGYEHDEE